MRLARAKQDGASSTREIADDTGIRYLVERNRVANGDTVVLCHDAGPADPETGRDSQNARLLALAKFSMDHASDGVFWLGPDGRFEYVNWAGSRMLGYEPEELRAMSIADIDLDVSRDGWPETWDRVRRNAPYTFEATHHGKDGRPIPVEISIFSVSFDDRELICFFTRDITERKQTEALLREQRIQAERSNRLKTEFLARMSHELRTPLNAIIGFAEIISDGHLGPEGAARHAEFGANILTSARHLHDLIKDVLDLTQIEIGAESLDPEYLDVSVLAETARTIIQPMAKNAGVKLRIDQGMPLPRLFADQRRMLQILVNLLSNGIKHTPAGSEVRLTIRHDPDSGWAFAVADRGPGIAPDDIPMALSVFGQLRNGRSDKADDGVGLGLPIVKALVERHAGSLDFEPRDGGGMVVTARIPDRRSQPANSDSPCQPGPIR